MNSRLTIYDLVLGLLLLGLFCFGCAQPSPDAPAPLRTGGTPGPYQNAAVASSAAWLEGFAPSRISILPLTELAASADAQPAALRAYVSLLDAFGCQIKAPGNMRLEVYQYVPRSAEAKGQRVIIWPDVDLTNPGQNNKYWQDFLRAYEFSLDAPLAPGETYIIEATFLCPDGRRLSAEFTLRPSR